MSVHGPNSLWHIGNFSVQYQKNYPNLYFSTLHERLVSKKTAWCTLYTATFQLICSTSYNNMWHHMHACYTVYSDFVKTP